MKNLLGIASVTCVLLLVTRSSAQPCSIRLELNDQVRVPFTFDANAKVVISAEGEVQWYKRGQLTYSCGPEGTKLDRRSFKKSVGLFGYLDPPVSSANDGELLAFTGTSYTEIGRSATINIGFGGQLILMVNDAWGADNSGAFSVTVGKVPLASDYDLVNEVIQHRGTLEFFSRNRFGDYMWSEHKDGRRGHSYVTASPIGMSRLTTKQVADILKTRIREIFPNTAVGSMGSEVKEGNIFTLVLNSRFAPKVRASAVGDYGFLFETLGSHPLKGTAYHGVFKDATGEYWLFQQGRGVRGEEMSRQTLNLGMAPSMWKIAAYNFRTILQSYR